MNRDDVIRMAREAGLSWDMWRGGYFVDKHKSGEQVLMRFAALVAAAERDACAKACEERRGTVSMFGTSKECAAYNIAVYDCAAAIRARGNQ